jgi:hypothetical protein
MITSTCLCDLNSVVIHRLGFPFLFFFQISKFGDRNELSDLQGNFRKNPRIFGGEVWPNFLAARPALEPKLARYFPVGILSL